MVLMKMIQSHAMDKLLDDHQVLKIFVFNSKDFNYGFSRVVKCECFGGLDDILNYQNYVQVNNVFFFFVLFQVKRSRGEPGTESETPERRR